ncbi:MAG: L,D-transpeptidase family protein [Alphaproteobacteria bacterium]|nr:L,D-transpeptidase family protein [Alphaproteobacteria bacterium]
MPNRNAHACRRQWRNFILLAMSVLVAVVAVVSTPAFATEDRIGRFEYYQITGRNNLLQVARLNGLGYVELLAANPGVDPWIPEKGRILVLPKAHLLPDAARQGIVINLAEMRLYFFRNESEPVLNFPIGIGRMGRETPVGVTQVKAKRKDPTWIPPASIRAERPYLPDQIPPGPRNPLGNYALDLAWPGYVIHGTNQPYGIGRRVSSGCIRLYPEDIEILFRLVSIGTTVTIVYQPVKLGWSDGELYMEVHPTATQADELEARGWFTAAAILSLDDQVRNAAGAALSRVAWDIVYDTARKRRGVPVRITR